MRNLKKLIPVIVFVVFLTVTCVFAYLSIQSSLESIRRSSFSIGCMDTGQVSTQMCRKLADEYAKNFGKEG